MGTILNIGPLESFTDNLIAFLITRTRSMLRVFITIHIFLSIHHEQSKLNVTLDTFHSSHISS